MLRPQTSDNCRLWIIRTCNNRLSVFYGTIYITVCAVLTERASPFPTIHHGDSAYLNYAHTQNALFAKMKLSSFARRFICERCCPELHSPQSLKPTPPSTETSSRLNGISSDTHGLPHLIRSLAYMATECGISSKLHQKLPISKR